MAVLGLHCRTGFALLVASSGCALVAVLGLLTAAASLVEGHRLRGRRLQGAQAPGAHAPGAHALGAHGLQLPASRAQAR